MLKETLHQLISIELGDDQKRDDPEEEEEEVRSTWAAALSMRVWSDHVDGGEMEDLEDGNGFHKLMCHEVVGYTNHEV